MFVFIASRRGGLLIGGQTSGGVRNRNPETYTKNKTNIIIIIIIIIIMIVMVIIIIIMYDTKQDREQISEQMLRQPDNPRKSRPPAVRRPPFKGN